MARKRSHIEFKVWLEIERYNKKTGQGQNVDAPGTSLATFGTYDEARDYAERVTDFADRINL
jgi:hypothetical protein